MDEKGKIGRIRSKNFLLFIIERFKIDNGRYTIEDSEDRFLKYQNKKYFTNYPIFSLYLRGDILYTKLVLS